jgi:hypothetical protein
MSSDISAVQKIAGFQGACLVEGEYGIMLDSFGGSSALDLESASSVVSQLLAVCRLSIGKLNIDTPVEEISLTLGNQIHMIRPVESQPSLFMYVVLDRKTANTGMAKLQLKTITENLDFDTTPDYDTMQLAA